MAKAKRVKMYNKGTRNWTLKDNGKDVTCAPGRCIDLDEAQANNLMKGYPHDFIYSGDVPVKGTKEVKSLKAENAAMKARIAELEGTDAGKEIKALKEENEKAVAQFNEMTARIEELEAAVPPSEPGPTEENTNPEPQGD